MQHIHILLATASHVASLRYKEAGKYSLLLSSCFSATILYHGGEYKFFDGQRPPLPQF